ncbi:MAG TPA: transcriptional repressor LexA [Treponemataceae bacterium]|nr:transcriptional repressor LexA [Treponemataceae bacterium]
MKGLTDRQREVLTFISSFTEENSCPPTIRETAAHFSISPKAIQDHFTALRKKGCLSQANNRSRSLRVLVDGFKTTSCKKIVQIPLLGTVAAGKPLFADENFQEMISLPNNMLHEKDAQYFALYVRGDSMIDAGIHSGDIAVIKKQELANNGQIIVALIEDLVTLKRFYRENKRIRLQAENEKHKPIYCQDLRILGVLTNILRNY